MIPKLELKTFWENKEMWENKQFILPQFNYERVVANTRKSPKWVHFGAGNIFRAFPSVVQQTLLNQGIEDTGIIVAEGFDSEIIDRIYRNHNNTAISATLKVDGTLDFTVVSSIVEALKMDKDAPEDFNRLVAVFENPSLQMASFTITEKGYVLTDHDGRLLPSIQKDSENDINHANTYLGKVVALLYKRYVKTKQPIALVSMDNISKNGDVLKGAIVTLAKAWHETKHVDNGFIEYLETQVSYPWSMIDKITPRPDIDVMNRLVEYGCQDISPIITAKGTYIAPFVNAEETQYLVVEDDFPNGRPKLEEAGVIFTSKERVAKVERMKVTTCLNPLHTSLALFGCLLDYRTISDAMSDETMRSLVHQVGYVEGLPVVVNPGIINPKEFIDEVVNVRLPNPFLNDTPQRIATDTSLKIPVRFMETIQTYRSTESLDVNNLKTIPLVIAGWIRYLLGVNDAGEPFEISADPNLDALKVCLKDVSFGNNINSRQAVKNILNHDHIFTVNLYETELGTLIESYFIELNKGPGAVQDTLHKYLG